MQVADLEHWHTELAQIPRTDQTLRALEETPPAWLSDEEQGEILVTTVLLFEGSNRWVGKPGSPKKHALVPDPLIAFEKACLRFPDKGCTTRS